MARVNLKGGNQFRSQITCRWTYRQITGLVRIYWFRYAGIDYNNALVNTERYAEMPYTRVFFAWNLFMNYVKDLQVVSVGINTADVFEMVGDKRLVEFDPVSMTFLRPGNDCTNAFWFEIHIL